MNKIKIGTISTTHGLKGEMKVRSLPSYYNKAYDVGSYVFLDDTPFKILSHRLHQTYDMIILETIDDISKAIPLKGKNLYKDYDSLKKEEGYLIDDLYTYEIVLSNGKKGTVTNIFYNANKCVIEGMVEDTKIMLPLSAPYVKVDYEKMIITVELIEGLM